MVSSSDSDIHNLGENKSEQEYATPEQSDNASSDASNVSTPAHERTLANYPPRSPALGPIPKRKPGQPPKRLPTQAELDQAADLKKTSRGASGCLTSLNSYFIPIYIVSILTYILK